MLRVSSADRPLRAHRAPTATQHSEVRRGAPLSRQKCAGAGPSGPMVHLPKRSNSFESRSLGLQTLRGVPLACVSSCVVYAPISHVATHQGAAICEADCRRLQCDGGTDPLDGDCAGRGGCHHRRRRWVRAERAGCHTTARGERRCRGCRGCQCCAGCAASAAAGAT